MATELAERSVHEFIHFVLVETVEKIVVLSDGENKVKELFILNEELRFRSLERLLKNWLGFIRFEQSSECVHILKENFS
jgi:hypothetical protein